MGPLERLGNVGRRLKDLKRKIEVHDSRDTRHIALEERIGGLPVREILCLLRRRRGPVGNLASLDNPLASEHARPGIMILQIVHSSVVHLPDALEVGFAIGRTRQSARAAPHRLGRGRLDGQRQRQQADE